MADEDKKVSLILDGKAEGLFTMLAQSQKAIESGVGQMTYQFNMLGSGIEKVTGIIGVVTAALAGGAFFKSAIAETVSWDLSVGKLAKTLGDTPQNVSVLQVALHKLGIEGDVVSAAALRMAKTMNTNSDAFKAIGVDIDAMKASGKSNTEMMMATIMALGEYKGGLDRNQVAMTIFNRSWGELQQLMKLTPEVMEEARTTAERLHLIIGPEGVKQAREYKESMRELELVEISFKHTIGSEMVKTLTDLSVAFGEAGISAAKFFYTMVNGGLSNAEQVKQWMGRQMERIPTDAELVSSGWGEYNARQSAMDKLDQWSLEKKADKFGGLTTPINRAITRTGEIPGKTAPGKKSSSSETVDISDQVYSKYTLALDGLNAKIAESNPYLTAQQKAMIGVDKIVTEHIDKMPQYVKSWNAAGEALKQNIGLTEDLKTAEEEHSDYLTNNDPYQNYLGKMGTGKNYFNSDQGPLPSWRGKSQQDNFDDSAMQADWATRKEAEYTAALEKEKEFNAMRADIGSSGSEMQLLQIQSEEDAWIQSWAMQTSSFEENARRMALIEEFYSKKRKDVARDETYYKMTLAQQGFGSMATISDAFYQLSGKKSKEALRAYQVTKSGETIISTGSAAMKAYDAMASIPYVGPGLGILAAAAAVAAGAGQMQNIWSVGADGSGGSLNMSSGGGVGGGSYNSQPVTQPMSSQQQPGQQITIQINGNVIGQDKWVEEELAPAIRSLVGRNVNFGLQPT